MNRPYMPGARNTRSDTFSMRRIVAAFVAFLIAVRSFSTLMTQPAAAEDDPAERVRRSRAVSLRRQRYAG